MQLVKKEKKISQALDFSSTQKVLKSTIKSSNCQKKEYNSIHLYKIKGLFTCKKKVYFGSAKIMRPHSPCFPSEDNNQQNINQKKIHKTEEDEDESREW